MAVRLVVTDLDGTLLDENKEISDEAVQAIRGLRDRGILFTFITGRPWCAAVRFARRAGIDLPVITCNGAVIHRDEQIIWQRTMELAPLRPVLEQAVAEGLTVLCSQDGDEFAFSGTAWARKRDYPVRAPSAALWQMRADKVNIMSGEGTQAFRRLLPQLDLLRDLYAIVCYGDTGCEIVARGNSKAAALQVYSALYGIPLEETLAIGDNENDLEMLRLAGTGAAVANATESAKQAADYVCESDRTRGVLEAIRRFCGEEREA